MSGIATGAVLGAEAGSVVPGIGTAIGGVLGGLAGLFSGGGKKSAPTTVPYVPVDLQATQGQAITGDLGNMGSLEDLLNQSNKFQQTQATQLMNQALPGYSQLASNLTGKATSLAANPYQVPQSVVDQLTQYAAENNIGEGSGAVSGFSQSNLLRSLGINALQYGQSNLQTASSLLSTLTGTAQRTSPMSPMSFLVTPAQQAQNQQITNSQGQSIGQGAANAAAAAANYNSGNLWDNTVLSLGSLANNPSLLQSLFGNGQNGSSNPYAGAFNNPANNMGSVNMLSGTGVTSSQGFSSASNNMGSVNMLN